MTVTRAAADLAPGDQARFPSGWERVTRVTRTLGQLFVEAHDQDGETVRHNLTPSERFEVIQ